MKKTIILYFSYVFMASLLLCSCKKQQEATEQGQLEFNFSISNLKKAAVTSSDSTTASTLTSIVVSLEDMNGRVVKNSEKVELYNMSGSYITKPLSLPKGSYKVTRFFVLDWQNNVVYASPVKGSAKAYLVTNPLPLSFTVQTNNVTKVAPEVVNASGCKPEDFGYATFSFSVAQTFDFLVGTFIYNDSIKNHKLTTSTVSIYSNVDSLYSGQLAGTSQNVLVNVYDSLGVTNRITLPESYNSYTLKISKPGYKTYNQTYTKEELKLHLRSIDKGPLVVLLEKVNIPVPNPMDSTVTDIDGNVYHTITIGTQVWMVENLKVTKYRNGDAIPNVTTGSTWDTLSNGAYCYYNNDISNATIYGKLYNGYAVLDNRGVCPTGWHVPSSSEFNELQTYLGGTIIAGGKLKEVGTTHWISPNAGATNETGFNGLSGGFRMGSIFGSDGFDAIGLAAYFWQNNISSTTSYWWNLVNYSGSFFQGSYTYPNVDALIFGCSIRCIKD